jgi:cell division protein FtsL
MVRPLKQSEGQKERNNKTGIRVKNSRTKKKKTYISYRQLFLIGLMLFIFMGSGIGYVWSNFEGTQIGYDLSRLQQKELMLKELNQKLKLEVATLKSPQNLEEAIRGMGLKVTSRDQVIILP